MSNIKQEVGSVTQKLWERAWVIFNFYSLHIEFRLRAVVFFSILIAAEVALSYILIVNRIAYPSLIVFGIGFILLLCIDFFDN